MVLKRVVGPMAAAAFLTMPAPATAQVASWHVPAGMTSIMRAGYADAAPVPYYEVRRRAYDQGYREGVDEGEKDARRGDRFAYQDEKEFRRGDRGYHRDFGERERYRQIFREGYAAGYSAGYSRIARPGRYQGGPYDRSVPSGQRGGWGTWGGAPYGRTGGGYYTPALDNGARDGYEKGLEDARKNRSFDPLRHSWYRSGDRHYEKEYGSREQYKDVYRRGFQRGYERGYREARNRW
jgi:flagellar biosynthesis/type III secretory pathway protein FliH